jgi:hypothetical protein
MGLRLAAEAREETLQVLLEAMVPILFLAPLLPLAVVQVVDVYQMAQLLRPRVVQAVAAVFGLQGFLAAQFLHTHTLPAQELLDKVILAVLAHFHHISHLAAVAALAQQAEAGTVLQTAMVVTAPLGVTVLLMLAAEAVLALVLFQDLVQVAPEEAVRQGKMKAHPEA